MYRSVGVSRRLVSTPGRPAAVVRVVTRSRYRRFATTTPEPPKSTTLPLSNPSITTTPKSNSAPPPPPPPPPPPKAKKTGFVRRTLLFTSVFAATFYGGSVYFSLQNEPYHDFFVDNVPLGHTLMDIAEQAGYGDNSRTIREKFEHRAPKTSAKVKEAHERAQAKKAKVAEKLKDEKERLQNVAGQLKTQKVKTEVKKGVESVKDTAEKAKEVVVMSAVALSDDVRQLVTEAEDALKGIYPTQASSKPPVEDAQPAKKEEAPPAYTSGGSALPLDWEPAPGYNAKDSAKLSAPTVSDLDGSDPMLAHLVSTLAQLGSMSSNPAAAKVLETAKTDLAELSARLSAMKSEEKGKLETALDEKAKEFHVKMLEMEMEAQDKIDHMDEEWRKYFDEEKKRVVETYRNKLNAELETQSELINQRLKEEVIAQGIEMQRRWIREVKVRVEQERGGRLAKLDELSASIARLERLTSDNALYLDDNLRAHALWSALRALSTTALTSSTRTPFREELRVLRHISSARDDPVITAALDTLDSTDVPDTGIEPLKDLSAWFDSSVVPHVSAVALVPDQNAGLLSYLASSLVSKFQFKREGKVEGGDVLSVLARARYYLSERDLDSAARELNQLGGPSKELLKDWLDAARRRLEVEQALEVVEAQAKLASLLVVA